MTTKLLSDHYRECRLRPFPQALPTGDEALDDEILDFVADLAEFDGFVIGIVEHIIHGRRADFFQRLHVESDLASRATVFMRALDDRSATQFVQFVDYITGLNALAQVAMDPACRESQSS